MITPRPFQIEAIAAIRAELAAGRRTICALPTGTGKTITALVLATMMGARRMLWLAHRDELIRQPIMDAGQVAPDRTCGIVKAGQHNPAADWVFASVQTAWRPNRIAALQRQPWDLIVIDECHHAAARTYRDIIAALPGVPLVGLTATPERGDNAALSDVFDSIAYQLDLVQAIRDRYLVPPRVATHRIDLDLDLVKTRLGDFAQGALEHELLAAGIVESIAEAHTSYCQGRKTIIFCVGVEQAKQIAAALPGAEWLSGKTPSDERREMLARFKRGEIQTIANCAVLTEGFDEPSADAIIMARPTQSKGLYIQCIGRGLRLYPGKTDCLIVDMVGVSERHTLMQAPVLFGDLIDATPREPSEGCDLFADEMSASYWLDRYEQQIKGLTSERRGHLRWVEIAYGMALNVGQAGTLVASCSDGEWTLLALRDGRREALTHGAVGLELVQGIAEDYVRRAKASGLSNGGMMWRGDPATSKQLALLEKRKLGQPATKGEAADALTAYDATAWYNDSATPKQLAALVRYGVDVPEGATKGWASRTINQERVR